MRGKEGLDSLSSRGPTIGTLKIERVNVPREVSESLVPSEIGLDEPF